MVARAFLLISLVGVLVTNIFWVNFHAELKIIEVQAVDTIMTYWYIVL